MEGSKTLKILNGEARRHFWHRTTAKRSFLNSDTYTVHAYAMHTYMYIVFGYPEKPFIRCVTHRATTRSSLPAVCYYVLSHSMITDSCVTRCLCSCRLFVKSSYSSRNESGFIQPFSLSLTHSNTVMPAHLHNFVELSISFFFFNFMRLTTEGSFQLGNHIWCDASL